MSGLRPVASVQQSDPLGWARALRELERANGYGWKGMTRFNRIAWREALAIELTDEERRTMPRQEQGRTERWTSR